MPKTDNTIQKALIGVAMVVLTDKDKKKYTFSTATKASAKIVIEEGKKIELVIKSVLKAQKKHDSTIKGVDVEFEDNMFLPEVVCLLQGGEIEYETDGVTFKKYTPPPAGMAPNLEAFDVDIYTEETDTSGLALGYIKLSLPNGKGEPVEFALDDDKFYASTYTIHTAPAKGQPAYVMEQVDELPDIS